MSSKPNANRLNPTVNEKENLVLVVTLLAVMAMALVYIARRSAPDLYSASTSTVDSDTRIDLVWFTTFLFISQFVFASIFGYVAGAHAPGKANAINPTENLAFVGWFGFGFAGGLWLLSYAVSSMLHMMHDDWQPYLSVIKAAQSDMQRVLPWIVTSVPFAAVISILGRGFRKDVP